MKSFRVFHLLVGVAVAIAMVFLGAHAVNFINRQPDVRVPFAVLGDSDSHSFHDSIMLTDSAWRGAEFRPVTFQWTEIIERLRSDQIDMGEWGVWGRPGRISKLMGILGMEDRAPRKQDYRFNFAISGATCDKLIEGMARQTQRLIYVMDQSPSRWANGIISIRIGINNIGSHQALVDFAENGLSEENKSEVDKCTQYIARAVQLIREKHKTTRIVLVGILSNADYIPELLRWRSAREIENIDRVLDEFDSTLRNIADRDSNILFWDDRAWFRSYFGMRRKDGIPDYRSVCVSSFRVDYTQGNSPDNAVLADGHAGTVWNGLWARDLLEKLNQHFGFQFKRITENEIVGLAGFKYLNKNIFRCE